MNEVTKRFVETYKAMGLTGYKMGKSSNIITKQKISNIEQGITDASIDIISDFCSTYLTVSCDYILTGNGPMFKEKQTPQNINEHSQVIQIDNTKQIRHMLDVINEQQKTIENLTEYIKKIEGKPKNSIENKKDGMTA